MKPKTFDCVEMKRKGAARLQQKMEGMTLEQKLAFWHKCTEDLRRRQRTTGKDELHSG